MKCRFRPEAETGLVRAILSPPDPMRASTMLLGLNHITFAVRDIERSMVFYRDVLGGTLHARWDGGAYLVIGDCWLCLSLDPSASPAKGYS